MSNRVLTQIEALRKATADADGNDERSFGQVFSSFLDIAGERILFSISRAAQAPDVQQVLEVLARQVTGNDRTNLRGVRMLRLAEAGFLHGGFFAEDYMGTFFFFEKEQQGLVAFTQGTARTYLSRVTLTDLPEGMIMSPGPEGPQ